MAKSIRESAHIGSKLGAFVETRLGVRGDLGVFLGLSTEVGGSANAIIKFSRVTGSHFNYITTADLNTSLDFPTITAFYRSTEGLFVRYVGANLPDPTNIFKLAYFDKDKNLQWTVDEAQSITDSGSTYSLLQLYAIKPNGDLVSMHNWTGGTDPDPNIYKLRTYSKANGNTTDAFVFTVKSGSNYHVGFPGSEFTLNSSNMFAIDSIASNHAKFDSTGASIIYNYHSDSDPYVAATSYNYSDIGKAPESAVSRGGLWTIDSSGVVFTMGPPRNYPNDDDTDQKSIFRFNTSNSITHAELLHASNTISAISLTVDGLYLYVHDGSTLYKLDASDLSTVWSTSAASITQGTATDDGGVIVNQSGGVTYYDASGNQKWTGGTGATYISGRPLGIE